jgi:DNA-binding MarR family transcriptional regulator
MIALQGTQLNMLQTIADIQESTSLDAVEDIQLVEEVGLDMGVVKSTLNSLAEAGYVHLEKVETLMGMGYAVSLTPQGRAILTAKV